MCKLTPNDDNDYSIEIDKDVYNQDFDYVNPGIQDEEKPKTDIEFE